MRFIRNKGFTLIELLVVIAIIGILSTLAIIALGSARQKARDSKRVADLNQIGKALELYYSDNNMYPTLITPGQPITFGSTTYLTQVPSNPSPRNDGSCGDYNYQYEGTSSNNGYTLSTCISGAAGAVQGGAVFVSSASGSGVSACGASIVDRDGYVYRTTQLGTQCWMADNLMTTTKPNGTTLTMGAGNERDCISATSNARDLNCPTGRALYTWTGLMNGSVTAGDQGICPTGWHVPTDTEWGVLETYLTDAGQTCNTSRAAGNYSCLNGGTKLQAGGSARFNGDFVGYRSGAAGYGFGHYNDQSFYWSSTIGSPTSLAINRAVIASQAGIFMGADAKAITGSAISVRCIKN